MRKAAAGPGRGLSQRTLQSCSASSLSTHQPVRKSARSTYGRRACGCFAADNFQRLKKFDHQAEREFVVDLRAFLLEGVANQLDSAADNRDAPQPSPEAVKGLLAGLPLNHQLVLFLKLAGYSDSTLEGILRITPTLAQSGLERLQQKLRRYPEGGA